MVHRHLTSDSSFNAYATCHRYHALSLNDKFFSEFSHSALRLKVIIFLHSRQFSKTRIRNQDLTKNLIKRQFAINILMKRNMIIIKYS